MQRPSPSKIIAVHLNYESRAAQRGRIPAVPSYFLKPPSSLAADGDPIVRPQGTELLTFEGEIALVIGRVARGVTPEQGLAHVGWYAPANDVGLYDMRWSDLGSNLRSKGQDGYTPVGPRVAAADVDPARLGLRALVNDEVVQEDTTRDAAVPVRPAGRRPLALHDARAGRHHPDRHACRLTAGRARRSSSRSSYPACSTLRNPIVEGAGDRPRSARSRRSRRPRGPRRSGSTPRAP